MRNLTIYELNTVSGGASPEMAALGVIGLACTTLVWWAVSEYSSSNIYTPVCTTTNQEVVSYREVRTPVYDSFGRFQGNRVDTIKDVNYVPVTVCS